MSSNYRHVFPCVTHTIPLDLKNSSNHLYKKKTNHITNKTQKMRQKKFAPATMTLLLGYWMMQLADHRKARAVLKAGAWGQVCGCYGYSGWSWQAQAVPSHSKPLNWSRFSLQGFTWFSSDDSSSVQVFSKARVDISGTGVLKNNL